MQTDLTPSTPTLTGFITPGFGDLPSMTLINASNDIVTLTYTVIPYILRTQSDTVFRIPYSYSIQVDPLPDVIATPPSQVVCSGTPLTQPVILTSGVQNTSFTWIVLNPPPDLSGFIVSGTGDIPSQAIFNSADVTEILVYTITPMANGCPGPSFDYSIQVNPMPALTFDPPSQVICSGEATSPLTLYLLYQELPIPG